MRLHTSFFLLCMALTISVINACPDKESETLSKRDNSLFTAIQSIWKRCPAHEAESKSKRSKESDHSGRKGEEGEGGKKIGKRTISSRDLFSSIEEIHAREQSDKDKIGKHVIQRKRLFSSKSGSDFEKRRNSNPTPSSNGGPDPPSGNIPGKRQIRIPQPPNIDEPPVKRQDPPEPPYQVIPGKRENPPSPPPSIGVKKTKQ